MSKSKHCSLCQANVAGSNSRGWFRKNILGILVVLVLISVAIALTLGALDASGRLDPNNLEPGYYGWAASVALALLAMAISLIVQPIRASHRPVPSPSRAAVRTVFNIHASLLRLSDRVEKMRVGDYDLKLDAVKAIVDDQGRAVKLVIEDYRDIVPGNVKEIQKQFDSRHPRYDTSH